MHCNVKKFCRSRKHGRFSFPALICFGFHNSALQDSAPHQMYFIARGNKTRAAEYIELLTTTFCDFRLLIKSWWKAREGGKSIWNMALNRPLANDSLNYCCNVNFRHFRQQGRKPDFPRLECVLLWTVTLIAVLEEQKLLRKCPMS